MLLSCESLSGICTLIIAFQVVKRVLPWLYTHLIGPKLFGPMVDFRKMGEWALITGATDGIGKSYAKALAKKGCNLVLVSRSKDKLEAVATELNTLYNSIQIKIIQADFTDGPHIYDHIENNIKGLEIGTLVNNVGMSYNHPEYFLDISAKESGNVITCNILSVTNMCRLVMPAMVERKKGVVINVSSLSARVPAPLLSVYGATKAFVDKFTIDLEEEYRNKGIIIQSVLPGFVSTNMSKIRKPSLMSPSADDYVESALNTVGVVTFTFGYFPHSLMKLAFDIIGAVTSTRILQYLSMKSMLQMRNRALRKKTK